MQGLTVEAFEIQGLVCITPQRFGDARGWFSEVWNAGKMRAAGIDIAFVQDNHSHSADAGTLRGLHYQAPPRAQDKLVRCSRGAIYDVAVDARRGSPSYGQWAGIELTAENGKQLFVPKGFLHGFVTLQPGTEVQYKCSDFYDPDCDGAVRWDSLGIDWQFGAAPVLSDKDRAAPAFADWTSPFEWEADQ